VEEEEEGEEEEEQEGLFRAGRSRHILWRRYMVKKCATNRTKREENIYTPHGNTHALALCNKTAKKKREGKSTYRASPLWVHTLARAYGEEVCYV
jgi:hypothetical protein